MKQKERQQLYAVAKRIAAKPNTKREEILAVAVLELLDHTMDMISMLQFIRDHDTISETQQKNIARLLEKIEA